MTLASALLLGALQGLTEFLPVSSSGHLALLQRLLGVTGGQLGIAIAVHAGTLFAVLWVYGARLLQVLGGPPPERRRFIAPYVWGLLGTVPGALLLADPAERAFGDLRPVAAGFLVTSLTLLLTASRRGRGTKAPRGVDALLVGLAQGVAVWPGLSRSGATIGAAQALGAGPDQAAEFSFLLAVPTVAAALGREILRGGLQGQPSLLAAAAAAAALSGIASLRFTTHLLRAGRLRWFAVYTVVLAGVGFWLG